MRRNRIMSGRTVACLALVLSLGRASASDWYVATNGSGSPGTDWATAFTNLQLALNAALSNDTVYLAGHTFRLTNQLTWTNSYVTIRGGYAATNAAEQPGPYDAQRWPTVLNAAGSSNRVMTITNVTGGTLERATLTGGLPYEDGGDGSVTYGGGVKILNSSEILLSGCIITNNSFQTASRSDYGGGLSLVYSGVTISNCVVRGNTAIAGTVGTSGGWGNNSRGGGIYINGGTVTLRDSVIANNLCGGGVASAPTWAGGGIYNISGTCIIRNCLVYENSSGVYGDANHSGVGDGIQSDSGTFGLTDCTVANNTGQGICRGGGSVYATNCIAWGNGDDIVGTVTLAFSDIEDGDNSGVSGCISADPLFEYGYYLKTNSPCMNTGTGTVTDWGLSGYTTRADGSNDTGQVDLGYHSVTGFDLSCADLYVSPTGNNGNSGTNWAEAFKTITMAFSVVRDGTRVHVASGTYSTNSGESFPLTLLTRAGVQVTGTNRTTTVLNAAGSSNRVMTINNCANVMLSELTLTGGKPYENGGDGSATYGGGIKLWNCSEILLSGCVITNNSFQTASRSDYGGGLSSVNSVMTISNCVVNGNTAYAGTVGTSGGWGNNSRGGGVYLYAGTVTIRDSVIANNLCGGSAGASGVPTWAGGGLYNAVGACLIRNCLLYGNSVGVYVDTTHNGAGDGILSESGSFGLANCTVANNNGQGIYRLGGSIYATNCIVWGNGDDITGAVSLAWSDIEDGDSNGVNGCISADPLFEYGYYLKTNSLCVDAGTGTASAWSLSGYTTRADGANDAGQVDMGYHSMAGFDLSRADLYVAPTGNNGNSGTNSAEAYKTITMALSVACDGTRVHVASGTYSTSSGESFPLTVVTRLGVQVIGTNRATTVLNAAGSSSRVMTINNCANVTLADLTLTGGKPYDDGGDGSVTYGGGVKILNSSEILLSGCIITNNSFQTASRSDYGGGLSLVYSGVTISNCVVRGNTAIAGTVGTSGGWGNNSRGGGIYIYGGTVTFCDSIIASNMCGGGVASAPTWAGGGVYSIVGVHLMRSCLVYGNSVAAYVDVNHSGVGDGIQSDSGSFTLENCTVANNTTQGVCRAGGTVAVTNCIVWGNGDDIVGTVTLAYSDIEDGDNNGTNGCISADPRFQSISLNDYRCNRGSPCIDAGTNMPWMTGTHDLAGKARVQAGRVDMGCYETPTKGAVFVVH